MSEQKIVCRSDIIVGRMSIARITQAVLARFDIQQRSFALHASRGGLKHFHSVGTSSFKCRRHRSTEVAALPEHTSGPTAAARQQCHYRHDYHSYDGEQYRKPSFVEATFDFLFGALSARPCCLGGHKSINITASLAHASASSRALWWFSSFMPKKSQRLSSDFDGRA